MPNIQSHTTIVFITYNSAHLVESFLSDLPDIPIIVVDNASKDNTCTKIRNLFPQVHLIQNPSNSGYGRAANIAFKTVTTDFVLLANPDTKFTHESVIALEQLFCQFEKSNSLFIAPNTGMPPIFRHDSKDSRNEYPREVLFASGAAILFNLHVLNSLQGFDENIFLYYEETDLCKRAQKNNLKMYYSPDIKFDHSGGNSSPPSLKIDQLKQWHFQWSSLYYNKKHKKWILLTKQLIKALILYPVKLRFLRLSNKNRLKYICRTNASRAFVTGKKSFIDKSSPFIPELKNTGNHQI